MVRLCRRLAAIAGEIEPGQAMADIGTDHGLLPVYLWERGICRKIIMTDISGKTLTKARTAFSGKKCRENVDFRVGDGLKVIGSGEVDVVVIAGMGGALMADILAADKGKALSFGKYVFQPRNKSEKLRFWLEKAGFRILSEQLAEEGKFICEIITATPIVKPAFGGTTGHTADAKDAQCARDAQCAQEAPGAQCTIDISYEIPGKTAGIDKGLLCRFLKRKRDIEKNILEAMIGGGHRNDEKIGRIEERIEYLEGKIAEAESIYGDEIAEAEKCFILTR